MALPKVTVTEDFNDAATSPVGGILRYRTTSVDIDLDEGVVLPIIVDVPVPASGIASVDLWPNAAGIVGSGYKVSFFPASAVGLGHEIVLGEFTLAASPSSTTLRALLNSSGAIIPLTPSIIQEVSNMSNAAAQSAANALASETAAANSETNAANSETAAANSEANAAASETNAADSEAGAASFLAQTIAASQALAPIDALHPAELAFPSGWWDTKLRLLVGTSTLAIISNWQVASLLPGASWMATVGTSVHNSNTGDVDASLGGAIGEIEDQTANARHLTQASASLRPVFGRRPSSGIRNLLQHTETFTNAVWGTGWTKQDGQAGPDGSLTAGLFTYTSAGQVTHSFIAPLAGAYTLTTYIKVLAPGAAGSSIFYIRNASTATILATGALDTVNMTMAVSSTGASGSLTSIGNGWYKLVLTSTIGVTAGNTIQGYFGGSSAGTGMQYLLWHPQIEVGAVSTAYQRVGIAQDVTEVGFQNITYADFDLVDDSLVTGAIAGGLTGQAFVAGDGGCYISPVAISAGGTFSLGGTSHSWTGAPPNILRAVTGETGRVLEAMLRASSFSAEEIARLERRNRGIGGKGLLVPNGVELLTNGSFASDISGWTNADPARGSIAWVSGELRMDATGGNGNFPAAIGTLTTTLTPGLPYLVRWDARTTDGATTTGILLGAYSNAAGFSVAAGRSAVVIPSGTPSTLSLYGSPLKTVFFDNVSVQRLVPREEL